MAARSDGTIVSRGYGHAEGMNVAHRDEIVAYCDEVLRSGDYQDLSVNGLKVEGSETISRLAVAVSTSAVTLDEAIAWQADALLVHHGLLYGSRMQPLTGLFAQRLRRLFQHSINLIGYHLPLDGHEELGNCAQLASACGFAVADRFAYIGGQPLGVVGESSAAMALDDLLERVEQATGQGPIILAPEAAGDAIKRVGFLTGSGYSVLEDALAAGCSVLVTGDVREPTMADARELGITVIAAGHEATERLGVQALAQQITDTFNIDTRYFHDPNPV
jgi:dinuclear metal center YbgI/SA1388 family protein